MEIQQIIAVLLCTTAIASYINYRYIRLPQPIGMTLITVIISLLVIVTSYFGLTIKDRLANIISHIDFSETILRGMLSYLLFAGSLHINSWELARYRFIVGTLATVGVVISTAVTGGFLYAATHLLAINLPLVYCMVFGALISPTDPIAVLSILKNIHVPKSLELKIAGESLFNDGMGIVVFLMMVSLLTGQRENLLLIDAVGEFLFQAGGAIVLGYILAKFVANGMCRVGDFEVATLMTLALVTGGYSIAESISVSGPITMVVAGLVVGNKMRSGHLPDALIRRLDTFWALVDDVLNSILFVLIGLEMLKFEFSRDNFTLAGITILIVLFARFISVYIPVKSIKMFRRFTPFVGVMTWGGLRGGVSIALVLSLPNSAESNLLLSMTYAVVLFSILVQGLTLAPYVRKTMKRIKIKER